MNVIVKRVCDVWGDVWAKRRGRGHETREAGRKDGGASKVWDDVWDKRRGLTCGGGQEARGAWGVRGEAVGG